MNRWFWLLVGLMLVQPAWALEEIEKAVVREPVRALHFVLRGISLNRAYWMVDEAKQSGLNTVVVQVTDGVTLKHAPWRGKDGAWSRDEFKAWIDYVQGKGMQVVPELKLLTHQDKFLQNKQTDLMFNSSSYDPSNPQVYQKNVYPLIDELVELISPKAFHIGHDEVAGHNAHSKKKWLKPNEPILPAEIFYQDTVRMYEYLDKRGIETWMWGDMLISPDEFPTMKPNSLHGTPEGYGKALRQKLPKDIVICDWHYADDQADFLSLKTFKQEGFSVLGATWKKEKTIRNFSRYAAQHGADGMIATTWFHVQRRKWDVVERIIRTSGRIFIKDFPDAR